MAKFGWQRVVVVHDDTLWGRESAAAFVSALQGIVANSVVLNRHTMEFPRAGFEAGLFNASTVLDEIARARGRIVFTAVGASMMRAIFTAFDSRTRSRWHPWFQKKRDFAWLVSDMPNFQHAVRA
jgi:ABC-type branched-subunit amino acid transport system substrate-binding protein